jgi:hypothetical protein
VRLEIANLGRQRRGLGRIDVRRVRNDEIAAGEVQAGREVGGEQMDAVLDAVAAAVPARPGERSVATTRLSGISRARVTARQPEPVPTSRSQAPRGGWRASADSTTCSVSGRGMRTRGSTWNGRP